MRIPIAPEGYSIIGITTVIWAVSAFSNQLWVMAVVGLLWVFVVSFFRDPARNITRQPNTVYSAADGLITEIDEKEVNGVACYRIVTFLSVFNCHVNRIPYQGTVTETTHTPGKFLAAYKSQIDKENERQETIFESDKGPMKVVQITGAIARRIFCYLNPGQAVKTGDRFGLIRFGSRTDVYIPKTAQILVSKKQLIKGGITPIAKWDR